MKTIFVILIFGCMVFTNLPLQGVFGTIAASPMLFVSLICSAFYINKFQENINKSIFLRSFFVYTIITFFISMCFLAYVTFVKGEYFSSYGDLFFEKLFRAISYNVVYVLCVYSLTSIVSDTYLDKIYGISTFFFFILVLIGIVQYFNLYDFRLFHNDIVEYDRIRLLAPEPSMAAFVLNIFGGIAIAFFKRNAMKIIVIFVLVIGNVYIGSKASLAYIVAAIIVVVLSSLKGGKRLFYFAFSLVVIIPLFYGYFYLFLTSSIENDISTFTSIATRTATTIWSVISILSFPLGQGYGTYLYFSPKIFESSILLTNDFFNGSLNTSELYTILQTGRGLSVKSGILSQVIYNGVVAIIFYFFIFFESYKKIEISFPEDEKNIFKVIVLYSFLSLALSVNMELMYVFVLPLVIINCRLERNE